MLILPNFAKFSEIFGKILTKIEIAELCKGVHCVDLDESFQTYICLQNLASIQPRTGPLKLSWKITRDDTSGKRRKPQADAAEARGRGPRDGEQRLPEDGLGPARGRLRALFK